MEETKYYLGFSLIPGVGSAKFLLLEKYFSNLKSAWSASASELRAAGLDSRAIESILANRPRISLDEEMEKLERYKVKALMHHDSGYPPRLKEIHDFPPILYMRGNLKPQDEWAVAVVGTRRATVYGRQVTEELVTDLAHNGITIVSGLARGIDAIAHKSALSAGGRTIAVFASGLDIVYPAEHAKLAQEVMEQGAILSDYPLGTPPKAEYFPRRNRIMSGLSLGVLVVEAGESSGALITAHLALEQNREVFAIPGSILSPLSQGTNRLIQEGAKLVRNCSDILEELNLSMTAKQIEMKELPALDQTESLILRHLSAEPVHVDDICHLTGLPISQVSSILAMMELKGLARQVGGMNFVLSKETREVYRVQVK